jgi:hypothetical protein
MISSIDLSAARNPKKSSTDIRMPLIQGLPLRLPSSIVIMSLYINIVVFLTNLQRIAELVQT